MSNEVQVIIVDERLDENTALTYGSEGAAGLDLRACIDEPLTLKPGEWKLIPTGLKIFLDETKLVGFILPRSGMGHKHGIVLGNLVGVIDSDYQGQLQMSIWNRSTTEYTINPLDRVAQYVITPVFRPQFNVVKEFTSKTNRGEGGFNSTGVK